MTSRLWRPFERGHPGEREISGEHEGFTGDDKQAEATHTGASEFDKLVVGPFSTVDRKEMTSRTIKMTAAESIVHAAGVARPKISFMDVTGQD